MTHHPHWGSLNLLAYISIASVYTFYPSTPQGLSLFSFGKDARTPCGSDDQIIFQRFKLVSHSNVSLVVDLDV